MYDYFSKAPKSVADIADQARQAEKAGFDSVWVMDHVFIQRSGGRVLAHDPMVCLAHVAAATRRITVGSLVLSHAFRHVAQLAREAAALADSSGGRLVLGLGTGWHRPEFDALGLPFDHRVSRLEEAVDPLQRLLRGEQVTSGGKWLRLSDASIAVTAAPPPIWIAAEGPRMLALAARSNGWNHAYWGAGDTTRFHDALDGLHQAIDSAGRKRADVETSASIACVLNGWQGVPDGFREPEVAVGSAAQLAGVIHDYAIAGADHVILSLSPDPYAEVDPSALEKSAKILELL
jgi:alkanesulfonate monooxygenase SsuD/methylene tetrahydromethanopterin reductase-like flavin-dependent oxidoreductase (luciferase family)